MAFTAAKGTLLKKGDGASPEVFTTLAQVGSFTGPGQKLDTIDTTTHNQASAYKAFIGGLQEGGEVKFPIFLDPADLSHTGLFTTFDARVPVNWQLVPPFSPTAKWTFAGLIIDISHKYELNGAVMSDITIKVSGKPVLA